MFLPASLSFLSFLDIYNKFLDFPVSYKNFGRLKSQSRSAMKSAWKSNGLNVEFLDILWTSLRDIIKFHLVSFEVMFSHDLVMFSFNLVFDLH